MSFYKKYELLELVRDDGIKTFAAREIRTGMPVQVHLFTGVSPAESDLLWSQLDAIPLERRRGLFAQAAYEGTRYVVTESLISPENLRTWVSARTTLAQAPSASEDVLVKAGSWKIPSALLEKKPESQPAPTERMHLGEPSAAPTPPVPESGEFTRMFQSPPGTERPAASTERMNLEEPPTAPPPPVPGPGPGEFTRMFQSPPETERPVAPTERMHLGEPPTAPPPPVPGPGPGEFTRMFQSPPETERPVAPTERMHLGEPPAAPPPPVPGPGPGEFTRMFQSPPGMERPAVPTERMHLVEPPAAPPPPVPGPGPGEFTRMFQSPPEPPVSHPAKPAPPPERGEFTRMFAPQPPPQPEPRKPPPSAQVQIRKLSPEEQGLAPEGKPRPVFLTPDHPAAAKPGPVPPAQCEPGEFTRMFQAPEASREEPGDFTRMFSAPSAKPQTQLSPEGSGPGDFTRMFQSPPQPEKPRQPPPASGELGEFTRFFENAPGQAPWPPAAPQGPPPHASHPGPLDQPGEFTRMFGGDATLQQSAREPAPPYGGATQSFAPPPGLGPPSVPSTGSRGAPGEYTRMIERPREFSAEPQPPQPFNLGEQRAGVTQKPSYLPLILIFGVLFLLAVAVVLFFVLRKP